MSREEELARITAKHEIGVAMAGRPLRVEIRAGNHTRADTKTEDNPCSH